MNYLFLSFVLVCFIVFLVEIPDVIMTLQIYNSYVWVTKKKTRIETAHAYRSMYDLDHVCTLFDGTQLYLESTIMALLLQEIFIVPVSL